MSNRLCCELVVSGWAVSLDAMEGEWSDDFSFLMIAIELTDTGHGQFLYRFNENICFLPKTRLFTMLR